MPHAALFVVQARHTNQYHIRWCFNAARGFVCGASTNFLLYTDYEAVSMPHAALFVVQGEIKNYEDRVNALFQCRTRLCLWCKVNDTKLRSQAAGFNAARGFVCGARVLMIAIQSAVSSFNAARGFVCGARMSRSMIQSSISTFQCRTRLCLWCKIGIQSSSSID